MTGKLEVTLLISNITACILPYSSGWRTLPYHLCGQILTGENRAEFKDGRIITFSAGSAFFIPAGLRHILWKSSELLCRTSWAHFLVSDGVIDPLEWLDIPRRITGPAAEKIGTVCAALCLPWDPNCMPLLAHQARTQQQLFDLVATLAALGIEHQPITAPAELIRLHPVLLRLYTDPAASLDVAAMAEIVNLSPSRFHQVFKICLGMAPHQYQQHIRLIKASHLLVNTKLPIQEIAQRVGYLDPFHFSRLFKAATGKNPRQFRQTSGGLSPSLLPETHR